MKIMRLVNCLNWNQLGKVWLLAFFLLFFCEVLIYYLVLIQCTWPQIDSKFPHQNVKAMILSDTHMLGPRFGHWFDKLRREWQMYRTFQTAMTLHRPQVVFILGDIFDEGYHCTDKEFEAYMQRFFSLFNVPDKTKLYVVIGNHDIGFHYRVHPHLKERFEKNFNTSSVELVSIAGNHFVLVSSMALHGDNCYMCQPAEEKLKEIGTILHCAKIQSTIGKCQKYESLPTYSAPIFLQHFPLYRESDADCTEPDAAPSDIANESFRQTWECLSKESTELVLRTLEPRVAFSGHTHHGCLTHHGQMPEWTLPSFNWRNKDNPSFMLATFAPDTFKVSKCLMPREKTVIVIYGTSICAILIWVFYTRCSFLKMGIIHKEM